jgi:MarR family transcriptional regulator, organic hydroperoxide resistance regulator
VDRVDDQLCFALYAASRAMTSFYRTLLDEFRITYPQYLVLLCLWERDGVTVRDIGDALRLDYGTLSPLLKRMEAAGLVRRARSTDDERAVRISLTSAGRAMKERAAEFPSAVIGATGLSQPEIVALRDDLHRLAAAVGTAEWPPPVAVSTAHPEVTPRG